MKINDYQSAHARKCYTHKRYEHKVPRWATAGYLGYTVDQLMVCLTLYQVCCSIAEVNKEVKLVAVGQK